MSIVPLAIGIVGLGALMLLGGKKKAVVPGVLAVPDHMPLVLRQELGKILNVLRVQPDGTVKPPITKAQIQAATAFAGKLEAKGFNESARQLRGIISQASQYVPTPPPEQQPDVPGLSPEMRAKVARALDMERDPNKLRALRSSLGNLPPSTQRDALMGAIDALITQVEAKQSTDEALQQAQQVVTSPRAPTPGSTLPNVPPSPRAQPAPAPSTAASQLAQRAAASLLQLQAKYGVMRSKGRQDRRLVQSFQRAAGLRADGMPGPATLTKMAQLGVSKLPRVMYWPRGATQRTVAAYKNGLLQLATKWRSQGAVQRANELLESANQERGQAGVIR